LALDIVDIIRENLRQRILEGYPSFEKFAYENAIDKTTLSRILNGKREPKISTLHKIVKSLNLTLNDLYLNGNNVREKTPVYSPKPVKKRKIVLMLAEADFAALQDKSKSAAPLVLEARMATQRLKARPRSL
jgi:transcriptional regulator with XRE-family HTH domain